MTLHAADGTQLTKATAATKVTAVPVTDPVVQVTEDLAEGFCPDGTAFPPIGRRRKFRAGELIRQSQLDAMFPAAEITSVSPATGAVAGGTAITLKGKNFTPGTTVSVGGSNATAVTVVDATTIRCTTPAHAAGAVAVAVTTDAGTATKNTAFTYA
ncbi:IPT/TIG domain-containing protein [Nonomuraea sp. NPDC051941]|uniref:IPT/TIG domain-containing protein n=1 Tax=Nonomuraea sp. NPDC051941 TaxID=3364373 RepID=UPI0037CC30E1